MMNEINEKKWTCLRSTVLGANHNGSDEWYTPDWAVEVIADYLPERRCKILCPFDTKDSAYYKVLTARGHDVETSHIQDGIDFFKRNLIGYDYIISNPPFALRDKILTRLYRENVKFALLLNANGLFDSKIRFMLTKQNCSLIFIYPRVNYISQKNEIPGSPFQSVYWCRGILPDGSIRFDDRTVPSGQIKMEVTT